MPDESKDEIFKEATEIIGQEDKIMTIAMKFKEEGKIEGRLKEKKSTLYRQMKRKFKLSTFDVELIKKCKSGSKLNHALDEVLFADDKEVVLSQLK